jgi:hypothetical protein
MDPLRANVVALLRGGQAYDTMDAILAEFTPEERGVVPPGGERSAWQIVEHMRIALRDILEYSQDEDRSYRQMNWPDDYWPSSHLPSPGAWDDTLKRYKEDLEELVSMVEDPGRDLLKPFPWEPKHSLLRQALLAADHASYHLGQLVELKRYLTVA